MGLFALHDEDLLIRGEAEMDEAEERRKSFIADVVEACKRHRVMISIGGPDDIDVMEFEEHTAAEDGYRFVVGASEMEEVVRISVWGIVHPSRREE